MRMQKALAAALLATLLAGCAHRKHSAHRTYPPPPGAGSGYSETGLASWYGPPYDGRQAADGEIYNMETMVAAHRTLPFDTWVRVMNLNNAKWVEVRIIDRGPFVDGRIIDLSHAAARAIDLIGTGTAPVRIDVVRNAPVAETAAGSATETARFAVQVGAFRNRDNAERMRARMAERFGTAKLVEQSERGLWRVLVGAEPSEEAARHLADRIRGESGERTAFVVRLDS